MELMQLEMLVAVAEEHSFLRAAERVFRTQPAVSIGIRKLEGKIGVPLFDRASRSSCRLTPSGERLYEYARKILGLRDEALGALKHRESHSDEPLLVGLVGDESLNRFPTLWNVFRKGYPGLEVKMHLDTLGIVLGELADGRLDVALISGRPRGDLKSKNLVITRIKRLGLRVCVDRQANARRISGRVRIRAKRPGKLPASYGDIKSEKDRHSQSPGHPMSFAKKRVAVIKFGGSVLADDESYFRAARFLVRRLHSCSREQFVVVLSAQRGVTDDLERLARRVTSYPSQRTLDLLWATGEVRSVAMLTLHLEEMGVAKVGFNIHETGLRFDGGTPAEFSVTSLSVELRRAFDDASVVVVPGFFATLASGTVVSLGRGGSDLSAVLLAEELEAMGCELIKDVSGYFTKDPHSNSEAIHLPLSLIDSCSRWRKRVVSLCRFRHWRSRKAQSYTLSSDPSRTDYLQLSFRTKPPRSNRAN